MALKSREFLELVKDVALGALADPPAHNLRHSILQLHYGPPHQHYEVWVRAGGLIEIGLHFEGDREDNYRRIAVMAEAMPEIAANLGPGVEAEEWTERWTRVHEAIPHRGLGEDLAIEVGQRLACYIEVLEPLVRPLGPIAAPAVGGSRRRTATRRTTGAGRTPGSR